RAITTRIQKSKVSRIKVSIRNLKAIFSIGVLVFCFQFFVSNKAFAQTPATPVPPTFPSCMSLSSSPGDLAHYTDGMHQIAGDGLLAGRDDVYSLTDGNAVQCFCPPVGIGI